MTTTETPQPQQPQPQGALSGALSSLVAVGHYASRACAAIGRDFATLFARGASPAQRIKAAGGLALTAVIVAVLGYAALQEWQIHIVYQAQIQRNQAAATAADALLKTEDAIAAQKSLEQINDEIREQDRARGIVPDDLSCNQPPTARLTDSERKAIAAGHCVTPDHGQLIRRDAAAPPTTVPESPLHSLGYDPK